MHHDDDPPDETSSQEPDRHAAASDDQRQPRLPFPVVGVGASAGGLEAYIEFLQAMPTESGVALVLVQHLPPDRESLVAEILSRHTTMPVAQVEDGQPVEPNRVYVIRPGHTMTIRDGHLHLGESLAKPGHGRPVDDFFRSLAADQQQRAIAVILSGMGSNGTAGCQAIKVVGGMCIAQEPESAKFPSMPRNLIDSGFADFILRPTEMPEFLIRYATHPYSAGGTEFERLARRDRQSVNDILGVLRTRTRHDFTGYRRPTLVRRIQRRMGLSQVRTLEEYARALRQSPAEVAALGDDLLINVTGFFRDEAVWELLSERVIRPLVRDRAEGQPIRVWVAACSSGEEAYTLAMLLVEASEAVGKPFDIKIFATDMAERSLAHARAGVYPGGIESEISPERLDKFFDRDESVYYVKKELRERVVFAPQNVLQDPPFSRLDIVSCRNLLIYLEPEVQRRVLALMHFALVEGGTLLLGTSETVGGTENLFEPIDKKFRIYRRVGPTRHGSLDFPISARGERIANGGVEPRSMPRPTVGQIANQALLSRYTPAAVVVDRAGQVVFFHGPTERYLVQPRGEPTQELVALASEAIRGAVRIALQRVIAEGAAVTVRDGIIVTAEGRFRVEVTAEPLDRRSGVAYYLIAFTERPDSPSLPTTSVEGEPDGENLHEELIRAREELRTNVEELQTSNEELKTSNEEVTSINEELQSTNEELETSKEELQSLNEELSTVNTQLQVKLEELERIGNDLSSLLSSTNIAVLFLDPMFRIRRYTPATRDLIDLIPSDIGRPISDMAMKFADPTLLSDARLVLDKLVPMETEVVSREGRWYLRRVLPYRTTDNRIDGVVITLVDISERKTGEASLHASQEQLRELNEEVEARIRRRTWQLTMSEAGFRALVHESSQMVWTEEARSVDDDEFAKTMGKIWLDDVHPDDRPRAEVTWRRSVESETPLAEEFRLRQAGGKYRWSLVRAVPLRGQDGSVSGWVGMNTDVHDRKQAEEARTDLLRKLVGIQEEVRRRISRELHDQMGQLLTALSLELRNLAESRADDAVLRDRIHRISDLNDELMKEAHHLALELRPTTLDDLGLPAALSTYVEEWSARTRIEADLHCRGLEDRLPSEVETAVYRIIQEALTNVVKHAKAGRVGVIVERQGTNLRVIVEDDGRGFDPDSKPGKGIGLFSMRERAAEFGGTVEVESSPDRGTNLFVRIPLRPVEK